MADIVTDDRRDAADASQPQPCRPLASFTGVYNEHAPLLRRIATDKFGVPPADADALVHDVFLTYLADPTQVREVRAYLVGAICNASRHFWRSKSYERALFETGEFEEPVPAWIDEVALRLTASRVLALLDPECREALERYYLADERPEDIAAVMQTTKIGVYQRLSRCRRKALRACLAATGGSPACRT